jgi:hypothetical protein
MKALAGCLGVWALVTSFLYYRADRELAQVNGKHDFFKTMVEREIAVLREQVDDMQFSITTQASKGTFEQGYASALVRMGANSGTYADGFADAEKKFKNTSYVDGYHNAIEQFGVMWMPPEGNLPASAPAAKASEKTTTKAE